MDTLLSCFRQNPTLKDRFHAPRFRERLSLVNSWQMNSGQRILDIGCGQGESSLVLAFEQGESGHVTAIDTASPDYGSPFTVAESQQYISKSILGPRITFLQTDAETLLQASARAASDPKYDAAVLFHSLWYFPNTDTISALFRTLARAQIPRIYLAEYVLEASTETQIPHLLAAKAQALFHSYRVPSEPALLAPNIRTALDQAAILKAANDEGFEISRQGKVVPEVDFLEAHFEAKFVQGDLFQKRVVAEGLEAEREAEVLGFVLQVREEMEKLTQKGLETVRPMDVWWAELVLLKS